MPNPTGPESAAGLEGQAEKGQIPPVWVRADGRRLSPFAKQDLGNALHQKYRMELSAIQMSHEDPLKIHFLDESREEYHIEIDMKDQCLRVKCVRGDGEKLKPLLEEAGYSTAEVDTKGVDE